MKCFRGVPNVRTYHSVEFGKLIAKWSCSDIGLSQLTIEQLNQQLMEARNKADLSTKTLLSDVTVRVIPTPLNEWVVRLPPLELINWTLAQLRNERRYPVETLPSYFRAYPLNGAHYDEDFLYVRLADFTVTQCG